MDENKITNICVIVCFWNTNPKYLEECFYSIDNAVWMFKRYYKDIPINVHVMDDGTDRQDTLEMFYDNILTKYPYIKYWKHEENTTLATAINDLNEHTPDNALVVYLDSDDMMMPQRIIMQYEIMSKNSNVTLCCTNSCTSNMYNDTLFKLSRYVNKVRINDISEIKENPICHPTICYRINDIRKHNIKYDDDFDCMQDFDFNIQVLNNNLTILFVPYSLTWWRQYPLEDKPDINRNYDSELKYLQYKWNNNKFRHNDISRYTDIMSNQ